MKNKEEVISGVKEWAKWWIKQRRKKLEDQLNDSMSINPFMMPFLFDYHNLQNFEELAELIVASHLMVGHNTGFGKLIDEKILPKVFGAKKLDATFRKTDPYNISCFDEIDHIIERKDGTKELLCLKAGKWTIQLTMAVKLNNSFSEILRYYPNISDRIVVGVFYGKQDELTDKYEILRGINRGANHHVTDITEKVFVYAGRDFWSWLNYDQTNTQEWVLQGIQKALAEEKIHETASKLLQNFKTSVVDKYEKNVKVKGEIDWKKLLEIING